MYFYLEFEDVGFLFLIFLLDFLLDLLVGFAYWICLLDLLVGMLDGFLLDGLTCSMLQHLQLSRHFDFHSIDGDNNRQHHSINGDDNRQHHIINGDNNRQHHSIDSSGITYGSFSSYDERDRRRREQDSLWIVSVILSLILTTSAIKKGHIVCFITIKTYTKALGTMGR